MEWRTRPKFEPRLPNSRVVRYQLCHLAKAIKLVWTSYSSLLKWSLPSKTSQVLSPARIKLTGQFPMVNVPVSTKCNRMGEITTNQTWIQTRASWISIASTNWAIWGQYSNQADHRTSIIINNQHSIRSGKHTIL